MSSDASPTAAPGVAARRGLVTRIADRLAPPALGVDFRRLWSASAVSNLGDGLLLSAGPLLVTTITREPVAVAGSVFLQQLPWVLFAIPAGAFIDRHDRRRIVIVVNALRAAVLLVLAAAIATGTVSLPVIYGAVFLIGTAETFADLASHALVATTVPKSGLGVANARMSGTATIGNNILGPSLGAVLFALGAATPFALDGLCALLAAGFIARVATQPMPSPVEERRHLRGEIASGIRWLWHHPPVRALFLTILLFNVTFGAAMSVYVLLAKQRLGLDDTGFGLLLTVGAVGGILGAWLYPRLERRFALATVMRVGLTIETLTHLVLANATSAVIVGATMVVFEAHAVVWGSLSIAIRQRAVPSLLLGRVGSLYMLGVIGGMAAGSAVGGVVAQVFGVTGPFWFAFVGSAVLLVVIWRTLGDIAHAPDAEDDTVA